MSVQIEETWKQKLKEEFESSYFQKLTDFVRNSYKSKTVYPHPKNIFRAFSLCPFEDVKVVIIGQDPYHGPNQANGLCFSVNEDIKFPPSLKNIFKEMVDDIGGKIPESGDLGYLANQGVLLLNSTLTVEKKAAGSHQNQGWEKFTDAVIKKLSDKRKNLVFILWGRYARDKAKVVDREKHLVLESPHPSPFSAHSGFFGSKPFSKTNQYLTLIGQKEIQWLP